MAKPEPVDLPPDRMEFIRANAVALVCEQDALLERLRERVRKLEASNRSLRLLLNQNGPTKPRLRVCLVEGTPPDGGWCLSLNWLREPDHSDFLGIQSFPAGSDSIAVANATVLAEFLGAELSQRYLTQGNILVIP